jgi:hypothetical protein
VRARLATVLLIGVALVAPAHAGAATISGADGRVWNAADPSPTYTVVATRGAQVEWRLEGRGGGWTRGRAPLVVTLDAVADGSHVLLARDRRGGGDDDDDDDDDDDGGDGVARRRFRVDTVAPRIQVAEPRAGASYALGQHVAARYSCAGAVSCAGPVADGAPLATDRAGPVSFVVRALDDAGNASALAVDYSVAPPPAPAPPPPAATGATPAPTAVLRRPAAPRPAAGAIRLARNHRVMSPAAASRLRSLRPLLRWRPRRGALLYNVQVFEVNGAAVRKVLSAFPAGPRLRVPSGTLARGRTYAWRVWPYLRAGYPSRPIGVSTFVVGPGAGPA